MESTPVKTYNCPSLRGPTVFPYTQNGENDMRAMMDYVGNGGRYPGSYDGPLLPSIPTGPGPASFAFITDGTSNTLLAGDKYLDRLIAATQSDCNDDQGWVDGYDNDTMAWASDSSADPPQPPKPDGNTSTCGYLFGSPHQTLLAVFCDGSVHSVSFAIDPVTWQNLCNAQDGQPIDLSQF